MLDAATVTPQEVWSARLLRLVNDQDGQSTPADIIELSEMDPEKVGSLQDHDDESTRLWDEETSTSNAEDMPLWRPAAAQDLARQSARPKRAPIDSYLRRQNEFAVAEEARLRASASAEHPSPDEQFAGVFDPTQHNVDRSTQDLIVDQLLRLPPDVLNDVLDEVSKLRKPGKA